MNRQESIKKQVSDMYAVEQHILDAIVRQRDDERLKNNVEANQVVIEIERVLKQHISALDDLADRYDHTVQSTTKEALGKALGIAAGLYDRVRGKHPLSRDMRDNYVALSLAAMGATAFHTYGLSVGEERIADLAEKHLKDITPLLVEISKVIPDIVAEETANESDFPADASVAKQATANTQAAWSPSVTGGSGDVGSSTDGSTEKKATA
jgi:ferritin-like metal-binding protein YciE